MCFCVKLWVQTRIRKREIRHVEYIIMMKLEWDIKKYRLRFWDNKKNNNKLDWTWSVSFGVSEWGGRVSFKWSRLLILTQLQVPVSWKPSGCKHESSRLGRLLLFLLLVSFEPLSAACFHLSSSCPQCRYREGHGHYNNQLFLRSGCI